MKKNRKEEIQSRREFFKNAAKAALPMLGVALLASNPIVAKAAETQMGCTTCYGTCVGHCRSACGSVCTTNCMGSCRDSCYPSCEGSCTSCRGTCQTSCIYSGY